MAIKTFDQKYSEFNRVFKYSKDSFLWVTNSCQSALHFTINDLDMKIIRKGEIDLFDSTILFINSETQIGIIYACCDGDGLEFLVDFKTGEIIRSIDIVIDTTDVKLPGVDDTFTISRKLIDVNIFELDERCICYSYKGKCYQYLFETEMIAPLLISFPVSQSRRLNIVGEKGITSCVVHDSHIIIELNGKTIISEDTTKQFNENIDSFMEFEDFYLIFSMDKYVKLSVQ